jgi:hypothetical protein
MQNLNCCSGTGSSVGTRVKTTGWQEQQLFLAFYSNDKQAANK